MLMKIFVSVNFKLCRLISIGILAEISMFFEIHLLQLLSFQLWTNFDFGLFFFNFCDQILCSMFAISLAGIIHDSEPLESETDHHHKIDHEHATSHQSFKIHHFHAVPVYVKHEVCLFRLRAFNFCNHFHAQSICAFIRLSAVSVNIA